VPAAPVLALAGRDFLERPRGAPASAERVGQSALGCLTDQRHPNASSRPSRRRGLCNQAMLRVIPRFERRP
jgi:hypothetical protein